MRMARTAEDFLTSLGFDPMPPTFWNRSIFERPYARRMDCHASAWDFYDNNDYRIMICGDVNEKYFSKVYREMGKIAYMMSYKDQPTIYKEGANEAFLEAIGNLFTLSSLTPEHLRRLNLINNLPSDDGNSESEINMLLHLALTTVTLIPYAYLVDAWRWGIFNGSITKDRYMAEWHRLRCQLTGLSHLESNENFFLPALMYNVAANVPYIKYFFATFLQFQFHKAACTAANYTGPLHRCDLYNSTEAGQKLRNMTSLGSSTSWPEALEQLTGNRTIDYRPLLEYFTPLMEFLRQENGPNVRMWRRTCA